VFDVNIDITGGFSFIPVFLGQVDIERVLVSPERDIYAVFIRDKVNQGPNV
jgi:hypothetical protein